MKVKKKCGNREESKRDGRYQTPGNTFRERMTKLYFKVKQEGDLKDFKLNDRKRGLW